MLSLHLFLAFISRSLHTQQLLSTVLIRGADLGFLAPLSTVLKGEMWFLIFGVEVFSLVNLIWLLKFNLLIIKIKISESIEFVCEKV